MKNFIRAYTYTLVPTAVIVIFGFILFYSAQFSLNKSISLGTIHGFLATLAVNLLSASMILHKVTSKTQKSNKTRSRSRNVDDEIEGLGTQHSLYLLLDCEKAFDLIINSIIKQSLGSVLSHDKHRGFLSARTLHQTIKFEIKRLTRHTSEINIKAQKHNDTLKTILTYIKDKEKAYLQY